MNTPNMEIISHRGGLNKFKNTRIMRNLSIASLLYNPMKRKRDAEISHQRYVKYTVYEDNYPSLGALTGGVDKLEETVEYDTDDEYEKLYEETPAWSCTLM